jgi:protein phosphatase 2C family protein 2/3
MEKQGINLSLSQLNEYSLTPDRSGSCAIILLIVEKRCYIANVGDSRSIMSGHYGQKIYSLSRDHRPCDEKEYNRILKAGGKIYQTEATIKTENFIGPLRVLPGKLSVSRTFGDIEAKDIKYGGNPHVVISTPEIKYFDITPANDFILLGCDGIFEKMKNKEIIETLWKSVNALNYSEKIATYKDIHNLSGIIIEDLIEECLRRKSTDNLTTVIISLKSDFNRDFENVLSTQKNISQTTLLNKIPKSILHGNNETSSEEVQKNILNKIIKSSQVKYNNLHLSEKYLHLTYLHK